MEVGGVSHTAWWCMMQVPQGHPFTERPALILQKDKIHIRGVVAATQNNPRAHKIKIGTSPPPPQKRTKIPPPQNEELYGHGFLLQKERIFPGAHKIGAAISGPRIAGGNFYGHEDFSDF